MKILLGFIVLFFLISSFKVKDDDLVGMWMVNKRTFYFEKINYIPQNRSYFVFKKNGILEFKQLKKSCGDLGDEESIQKGSWKQTTDSTLVLVYYSCAGKVYAHWDLNKKSEKILQYRVGAFAGDYE